MNTVTLKPLDPPGQTPQAPPRASARKKILTWLAMAAITLAGVAVIAVASNPAGKDYISYWSAAKLLLHHADPYSPTEVLAIERAHGFSPSRPIIMRNPPWAMPLVAPLALGTPLTSFIVWLLAAVGCIVVFVRVVQVPPADRAFAFVFAPAIACITSGQSSPFLLLGFCLFLRLHRRSPFLAGVSLFFMALKPHLFLVFWTVLLVECIYQRRFRILAGLAAALAVTTTFAMLLDPHIWRQYLSMLRASALGGEFFPTASMLVRLLISPNSDWLLFAPCAVAIAWGVWYYLRNRRDWDWTTHGMLLMLVSVLASPYGWFTDEIILLPSLAFALTLPNKPKLAPAILLLINTVAAVLLFMPHASLSSRAFLWTPLAWFIWFLYTTHRPHLRNNAAASNLANQEAI